MNNKHGQWRAEPCEINGVEINAGRGKQVKKKAKNSKSNTALISKKEKVFGQAKNNEEH